MTRRHWMLETFLPGPGLWAHAGTTGSRAPTPIANKVLRSNEVSRGLSSPCGCGPWSGYFILKFSLSCAGGGTRKESLGATTTSTNFYDAFPPVRFNRAGSWMLQTAIQLLTREVI